MGQSINITDNQCAAINMTVLDANGQPDMVNPSLYTVTDPTIATLSSTNPYDSSAPPADAMNRLQYLVAIKPGVTSVSMSVQNFPDIQDVAPVQILATDPASMSYTVGPVSTKP